MGVSIRERHWGESEVVDEVALTEWTNNGHPSFEKWYGDKLAKDVVIKRPANPVEGSCALATPMPPGKPD